MSGAWESCFPGSWQAQMVQLEHPETQDSLTEEGTGHLSAFEFNVQRFVVLPNYSWAVPKLLIER